MPNLEPRERDVGDSGVVRFFGNAVKGRFFGDVVSDDSGGGATRSGSGRSIGGALAEAEERSFFIF